MLVITNNPKVKAALEERELCAVEYHDIPLMEVFTTVRDRIHKGYRLLTHPLSGSVKPNETHFKSIGISDKPGSAIDFNSLELIEQAIAACRKFPLRYEVLTPQLAEDFQTVDLTLILSVF